MKKNIQRTLTVLFLCTSLYGCTYTPGVPGLKVPTNQQSNSKKVGIDYKLVVINSNTIKKQKPFDYIKFINEKKKKQQRYALAIEPATSSKITESSNLKDKIINSGKLSNNVVIKNSKNFPGVSAADSKTIYQYHVGKQDILSITVWDHPELTIPAGDAPATHVVGNDGRFYFPYTGKIKASGETVDKIREKLEIKLKVFIAKPQVSVRVEEFRSQKVFTSGAISTPTTLQITDLPLTVRDAISKSGGVASRKYTGVATLTRNGDRNIPIDLNRLLRQNDNRQNFILKNGDRLHINEIGEIDEFRTQLNQEIYKQNVLSPLQLEFALEKERSVARIKKDLERELKSEQAKIFVMGEVEKPGSVNYQIEDGMTLAEAINDAGSFNENTANPNGIFVVRQESAKDTIPTVYQLPLASVHSMLLAEQFDIRPRDVVYVTATAAIRWNRVLALLLPSLTLLNTFDNLTN